MEDRSCLTNKKKALSIFKWTNRKYLSVSVAYCILMILTLIIPQLFYMMVQTSHNGIEVYIDGMERRADVLSGTFFAAIVILFSIIFSLIAFSYMHNKRCVDLFGSFPVSRRTLFLSRYASVLFICIVPMVVIGLLAGGLTLSMVGMKEVIKTVGILVLAIVGNVSVLAFVSLCCGTSIDTIICYCAINIVFPICIGLCYAMPKNTIPGMKYGSLWSSVFTMFSPIAAPFTGRFGTGTTFHIIWWICFSIVLFISCCYLCKKRKAETAQNTFAFTICEIVIKFLTCFAAGLGVGWMMAFAGTNHSVKEQYIWFFVGMIIGIMSSNTLLHIVFNRGLSKYKKSLVECASVAVVVTSFLLIVSSGALGIDRKIPDKSEIQSVCIRNNTNEFFVNGENLFKKYMSDEQAINDAYKIHSSLIQEAAKDKRFGLYPIVPDYEDEYIQTEEDGDIWELTIEYKLKDGSTFSRTYDRNLNIGKEAGKLINKFLITDNDLLRYIPVSKIDCIDIEKWGKEEEESYLELDSADADYSQSKIKKVIHAIQKDKIGRIEKDGDILFTITVYYCDDDAYNSYTCSFDVTEKDVNTIKELKDTGYYNIENFENYEEY